MKDTKQIFIIVVFTANVLIIIGYFIRSIFRRSSRRNAQKEVKQFEKNNTSLPQPCTITIKVICNNDYALSRSWRYGFSLNGAPPEFTLLQSVMTMRTNVERNALLGYGIGRFGGYTQPNAEEPFVFNAVSGGEIKLKANVFYGQQDNVPMWKSNLSFDEET